LRDPATAGSQVGGIRGGVSRLAEALAAEIEGFGIPVRFGARAEGIDTTGVTLAGGERMPGIPVVAIPDPAVPGRRVTLVTLVVDAPELAAAPRGTGVLVAADAPVTARALTHVTAKWGWVADAAGGRQVLRRSSPAAPVDVVAPARRDAAILLGAKLPEPDAAAVVTWERAAPRTHAVDGMHYVGEAVSGTGIAAVVAHADAVTIAEAE
jgi:oxygen-dependent protoporphyrinogen oxidase